MSAPLEQVVVHPLVLLSIVDHFNRVAKDTKKRVVGMLLGERYKGRIDVTNCYALPFEEDDKDPEIWFLDHSYHEMMFSMFKKINAKELVVGWYSTGPKLRESDLDIHALVSNYNPNPVLVIVDVQPKELGVPTKAYVCIDDVSESGTEENQKTFQHLACEIGAFEAEEIGVEHLLRDVKDNQVTTVANQVVGKINALKGLKERLMEIRMYMDHVLDGKLPLNNDIMNQIQEVFNLLPNLNVENLVKAFAVNSNDNMLVMYISSVIRSVIAIHDLINNKLWNKDHERVIDALSDMPISDKADKGKDKKDAKGKEEKTEEAS
mmetsp:Transcript_3936/g.4429  ORF Transcript_3936/g.4429 Transcript_3936/m.4429 type:complete len:321 (-) Transcript_3936:742-1704(-)|eukprot:CAMPEP_0197849630 /NCGR_PEP_ID=MMETSP1438-20131217/12753_1 /TAXON_ID=1461541 /ORGANISM="Pterosperma sp., Strain CCMP1384" /LENGTH=320 /DNA_ID=CAMNT_0043462407 /DNA_START=135 /DNA_END=1097 /DNA_ORIENTATION=-